MNARLFDQWLEANRVMTAPAVRWQEITAEAAQKLVQHNLAVAQDYVEFGTRNAQLLGEVKEPSKWVAEQGKLASEFSLKMVERTADYFKHAKETQESLVNLAETTAKTVAEAFTPKAAAV
jgi:hypothetical protein